MVIRLKGARIDAIEETDTRRLMNIKISSKEAGFSMTMDLPDALSSSFQPKENVDVIIDSSPIPQGEKARLHMESQIFRVKSRENIEVIGSIGGLRVEILLKKPTPAKKKAFESDKFYLAII